MAKLTLSAASAMTARISSDSLSRDTNDATGRTGTGVASLEGLLVVALAEVVSAGVHDNSAADNAVRSDDLDQLVSDRALGIALAISVNVAQVTNVARLVRGGTVGLVVRVEVRTGAGAAVGV